MTNQKENKQIKNQISLIMAILGLIVCIIVIIWLMFPGGNDGLPDSTPNPDPPPNTAREYWTAELRFHENNWTPPFLKRISVDDSGKVLMIESIRPAEGDVREEFFYENGRLEYSETYSISPVSNMAFMSNGSLERRLYQTRYVYMGDIIVKAEVYVDGVPTRSYDKYVYKVGGELDSIERYEQDKLEMKYIYNGNKYPERIECKNGVCYELTYDDDGNLTCAESENYFVEIDYENGNPVRFYKMFYDKNATGGKSLTKTMPLFGEKHETTKYYVYDDNGEIVEERSENVVTMYDNGKAMNLTNNVATYMYDYDGDGRLIDKKYYLNETFVSRSQFSYDEQGRVVLGVECDEDGNETERLFEVVRTDGVMQIDHFFSGVKDWTTVFFYDENGCLERKYEVGTGGYTNYDVKYEYYPSGALKKKETVTGKYLETWTYAENGNPEKRTFDVIDDVTRNETEEYIKSDVYYGFMRYEGFDYTFSLPLTLSQYQSTTKYTYREDLTLEKKTVVSVKGGHDVYEYDEEGNVVKETQYDAAGKVIKEIIHLSESNKPPKG